MKEVEKKDVPDISGGYTDECIPVPTIDPGYPPTPIVPFPLPEPEQPLL